MDVIMCKSRLTGQYNKKRRTGSHMMLSPVLILSESATVNMRAARTCAAMLSGMLNVCNLNLDL